MEVFSNAFYLYGLHRRWEVYHGHNSENGQWESQTTNPRPPTSLPFETIRFGAFDLKSGADELSPLSAKVKDFEHFIQRESDRAVNASMAEPTEVAKSSQSPGVAETKEETAKGVAVKNNKEVPSRQPYTNPSLDLPKETVEQFCLAAQLLSPANSGLYDELLTFVKMGILEIASSGIPVLAKDWSSKVDVILLDDIDSSWGTDADPDGRYCMNDELRDTLEDQWVKSEYGWAMTEDPDDLVFDFEVLDEWRQTFQGRVEQRANYSEGIGRFGL
jgi:hypothetical protein